MRVTVISTLSVLGLGRAKSADPTLKCSAMGQVSTLGEGYIHRRLSHEHSDETTLPRSLQGKKKHESCNEVD